MSTVPSSPSDRQNIKVALEQITASMDRIAAEKDHIKDVFGMLKEKFEIQPKISRKMAKTMYDRSYSTLQQENEDFELMYESIVEGMITSNESDSLEEESEE